MLYGESKSAGSCGHFKFHTKRDATLAPAGAETAWSRAGGRGHADLEARLALIHGPAGASLLRLRRRRDSEAFGSGAAPRAHRPGPRRWRRAREHERRPRRILHFPPLGGHRTPWLRVEAS